MTVIRPNSVSGINSITAQADEIKVFKSNGTQGGLIIGGANLNATTGISTILALNVTGNVSIAGTLTYQDVTNVDSLGIGTFRTGINVSAGQLDVGSNIKIGNAGVITATSFSGSGANLTGISQVGGSTGVDFTDNVKARFGTGNDLEIFHDSNNSIINDGGTGDLKFQVGGSTKFQTYTASGESGGLKLDGTILRFEGISQSSDQPNVNTGNPSMMWVFQEELKIAGYGKISFVEQGFTRWTIDGGALSPHGTTYNNLGNSSNRVGNAYIQTSVDLVDNAEIRLGTGDDLKMYHDGSHSRIVDAGTGYIKIQSNQIALLNADDSAQMAQFYAGGAVELYHNNDKKFMTQSDGVRVEDGGRLYFQNGSENASSAIYNGSGSGTSDLQFRTNGSHRATLNHNGHFEPATNNTYDLGTSSYRWRNVYTNDLHLSNEGSTNSVDNTWGNYTIQEGESDLFLINNRNGKKYKFNLTEVS